jgi:hypothetical protein
MFGKKLVITTHWRCIQNIRIDRIILDYNVLLYDFVLITPLGKLVTEKSVDFVGFENVVEFNKKRQNDDNVVKAYKG